MINHSKGTGTSIHNLIIGIGEEGDEVGENAGVEDGSDAGIEAAGEAAEGGGRLDEEVSVIGLGLGEGGGDGGDGAELEEGELLGAVSDDLVLDLSESPQLDVRVR